MEEIGDVGQVDVEVNGVKEGPVGVNVEAVDPRVGKPRLRRRLGGTQTRRWVATPAASRHVEVLLPRNGGVGSGGRKADEAECGHDWLEFLVGHDGLEGPSKPQGQLPHTQFHVLHLSHSLPLHLSLSLLAGSARDSIRVRDFWRGESLLTLTSNFLVITAKPYKIRILMEPSGRFGPLSQQLRDSTFDTVDLSRA